MKKRILSIFLILCLVTGFMPAFSLKASADENDKTIMWGVKGVNNYDYVYFGKYQQTCLGDAKPLDGIAGIDWMKSTTAVNNGKGPYYSKDPIKWRVLDNNNDFDTDNSTMDEALFLLSEQNLDVFRYHEEEENVTWETSTMRSWLNGLANNQGRGDDAIDYTNDNFLDDAFSAKEQEAIASTNVVYGKNTTNWIEGGNTIEKVFLLSIAETQSERYFTDDSSRIAKNTAYVSGGGKTGTSYMKDVAVADEWWLRSPGNNETAAAYMYHRGEVNNQGVEVNYVERAVRPAFNLDMNSVLFTSAAEGGKNDTVDANLTEVGSYADSSPGWKLTILDYSRSDFTARVSDSETNAGVTTLKISYSGAKMGSNEYISAMIKDNDNNVEFYGRLCSVNSTDGTTTINLPETFDESADMLYIFNEQYKGDYKTDYSSQLIQMNNLNYSVTTDLTKLSLDGASKIDWKQDYTATLNFTDDIQNSAASIYAICDEVKVYVGGSQIAQTISVITASDGKSGTLTIPAASITGDIRIEAAVKIYAVEVTNLAPNFDFGEQAYGYDSITARLLNIKNTGNQTLMVTLPVSTNFDVGFSDTSFSGTLAAGNSVDIFIKPKNGLRVGTYSENLNIDINGTSGKDLSQTINASFKINKANATDSMKTAAAETKYGASGTVDLSDNLAEGYELGEVSTTDSNSILNGNVSLNNGVLSFAFKDDEGLIDKTATVTIPVTSSTNYNAYNIVVTLNVLNKYPQTVSFAEHIAIKTYGDAVFINKATTTGDGTITYSSGDTTVAEVNSSTGAVMIHKAGETIITANAAETNIFKGATATYTLTVDKKSVQVSLEDVSVNVGSSAPNVTLTYKTLVNGDEMTFVPVFALSDGDGNFLKDTEGNEITDFSTALTKAVGNVGTYIISWTNYGEIEDTDNYDFYVPSEGECAILTVKNQSSSGGHKPPAQNVTVPISGDENTINVNSSVSGNKATVNDVEISKLNDVIGEDVNTGVVTIDFSGLNKSIDTVELPSDVVRQIAEAVNNPSNDAESLEIVFSDGTSIEFDAVTLGEKAAQADGVNITISIKKSHGTGVQQSVVGNRTAYDINITSNGEHISDMGGLVTVHAPYELKEGELPRGVVVYYVDENGNKEGCVTNYDSMKKRVNWKTDHLSLYMVGYDEELAENCDGGDNCPSALFTDLDTSLWYHEYTDYVIEKGMMAGVGDSIFLPHGVVSRAQIVSVLWRIEGEPIGNYAMNFEDVEEDLWYSEAIRWAANENIVKGWNNNYNPNDVATREQLATILWNYAKYKGYDVSVGDDSNILSYKDSFDVSEYAILAIQWANEEGIVEGYNGQLNPLGETKRCEFAKMITVFCDNYIF